MQKIASVLFVVLSLVLLTISPSHAADEKSDRLLLTKLFVGHDNYTRHETLLSEEKTDYSRIRRTNIKGERFFFNDYYIESPGNRKVMKRRVALPFTSSMVTNNTPPSMINNISFDFLNTKNTHSFDFSLSDLTLPKSLGMAAQMGAAFLTNLTMHEFGHEVVANHVDAEGTQLNFFKKQGGQFFLGTSKVQHMDSRSKLPYTMGGEFFVDLTFEHALQDYRENPNTYNKSLLLYSGTDFLWYCFYVFYISSDNPAYDPITISKETGISRDTLFSVALAKTILNAYRVYSGQDRVIPYFTVDKYSAGLNIMIPFDFGT